MLSSTLRDVGETVSPMIASVIAILVNLVLNYLLIFGSFWFPKMGWRARRWPPSSPWWLEMFYLVGRTYRNRAKFKFVQGAFRSFRIPCPW